MKFKASNFTETPTSRKFHLSASNSVGQSSEIDAFVETLSNSISLPISLSIATADHLHGYFF